MPEPKPEQSSRALVAMTIIGLVLLVGLVLYFWLGPTTPVVATPTATELTS